MMPSESGRRWLNAPGVLPLWERLEELGLCVNLCIASQDYNQFSDVVTSFPISESFSRTWGPGREPCFRSTCLSCWNMPGIRRCMSAFRVSSECLHSPHPYRDLWPVLEEVHRAFGAVAARLGIRLPGSAVGARRLSKCMPVAGANFHS